MFRVDFEGLRSMEDTLHKQISTRRNALGQVDDAIRRLSSMDKKNIRYSMRPYRMCFSCSNNINS